MRTDKQRTPRDYKELLRAGAWFRSLSEDFQNELIDAANLRHLTTGQMVMRRGEPRTGLFGVLEGSIRVGSTSEDGDEAVLVYAEPPTWFGEVTTFDGGPMTHNGVADRDSLLVHVPAEKVDALLQGHPERWHDMGRLMAMKVRLLFEVMEELSMLPASAVLARRLVHIAEGYGGWTDRIARMVDLSQEQLAITCAISRQTVNRVLNDLEKLNLVRRAYAGIEILDLLGLRKIAGRLLS
jgi:CRP-like cAMP-binding protein